MPDNSRRSRLIELVDASINDFNQDGRLSRGRATNRARRLTGMDWTYSALLLLGGLRDSASIRMSQLAESVGTTPPTVTKLIRDLESRGFITKSRDEQDGRASIISLTEDGRSTAAAIGRERLEELGHVLADWTDEDLESFIGLFERLRADMRRMT